MNTNPNEELRSKLLRDLAPAEDSHLRAALNIQPPKGEGAQVMALPPPGTRPSGRVRKKPLLVHVPPEVLEWAKAQADAAGRSLSSFVAKELAKLAAADGKG